MLGIKDILLYAKRKPICDNSQFSPKEERVALEAQALQYTSPYCNVVRAKIVLLAAEGLSNDVIAARLDTPRQIVSKWRKRFALARLPGLESQPRGRAPRPLFPPASSSKLRRSPVNSRIACSYRSRDSLFPRFGAKCSHRHTGIGSGD